MTDIASRISGLAMLALAALPIAALATAAHAETRVHVADIDVLTAPGVAAYNQRAEAAGRAYCIAERRLDRQAACVAGVRAELSEKLDALRTAQSAGAFAAR
jgi:UrcA family protein